VTDFYGASLCLCGIALATDGLRALPWVVGFLLIGSPVACAWTLWKAATGTLRLGERLREALSDTRCFIADTPGCV